MVLQHIFKMDEQQQAPQIKQAQSIQPIPEEDEVVEEKLLSCPECYCQKLELIRIAVFKSGQQKLITFCPRCLKYLGYFDVCLKGFSERNPNVTKTFC